MFGAIRHCLFVMFVDIGADVNAMDVDGQTAVELAARFGRGICERKLVKFTWRPCVSSNRPHLSLPSLLPHQCFDSALHASLAAGPQAQVQLVLHVCI